MDLDDTEPDDTDVRDMGPDTMSLDAADPDTVDPDRDDPPRRDDLTSEARRRIAEVAVSRDTELDLDGLGLTALPEELFDLGWLESLDLSDNELGELPEAIGRLTALTELYLFDNKLRSLPEAIGGLSALTYLDVERNELTALPESLGRLTSLASLDVSANPLFVLPSWIGGLTGLTSLSASWCELTSLPEEIGRLTALETLWLDGNRLDRLPDSLVRLPALRQLGLHSIPSLLSPPLEVWYRGSSEAVEFLRACERDSAYRWQSRVLVVGDVGVGKTSLVRRLRGEDFRVEEHRTHGLRVRGLTVPHPGRPDVDMALDLWDLSGRTEHRAANLSQLDDHALILLVWDARAGSMAGGVAAWLETLAARAPEAPILIVATHGEADPGAEPLGNLTARYPRIAGTCVVDSRSGHGIEGLRDLLARAAVDLPLMGVRWPRSWADASRRALELPGPFATEAELEAAIDAGDGTPEPSSSAILRVLLARGELSQVEDLPGIPAGFVVGPGRLQERIAEVVESPAVRAAGGVLSGVELARLWRGHPEGDPHMRWRMIGLMEELDLAYRIGGPGDDADVAVVVDALPVTRPADIDRRWRELADRPGTREAGAVYALASREIDVVTRLIAREHRFTTGVQWRDGVLLHDRDPDLPAWALVERNELEDPTVTLRVVGTHPARFQSLLIEAVDALVEERYAGFVSGPEPLRSGTEDGGAVDPVDPVDAGRLAVLDGIRVMTEQRAGAAAYSPALFSIRRKRGIGFVARDNVLRLWCEWPSGPHPLRRGAGKYRVGPYSRFTVVGYMPYLRCLIQTLRLTEYGPGRRSASRIMRHIARYAGSPGPGSANDLRTVPTAEFAALRRLFRNPGSAHGDAWDGLTAVRRPESRRVVYLCPEHAADFEYPYGSGGAPS